MGQCANRYKVHAGLSYFPYIGKRDVARGLKGDSFSNKLHRFSHIIYRHVIQHDNISPSLNGLLKIWKVAYLDFYLRKMMTGLCKRYCFRYAPDCLEVVVLDKYSVKQTEPVICSASHFDSVFLHKPQTGGSLPRIDYLC